MSGAETIAGLALAAPPIFISWLEHYRELFEMIGCWNRIRPEYRKVERQLQAFEFSLDCTLDKLFSELVESQDELQTLKLDHANKNWARLEAKLIQRLLPEVRTLYVGLLQDLDDAIEALKTRLGYDKPGFQKRLAQTGTNNVVPVKKIALLDRAQAKATYELERAKFSTRSKPIEAAMQKVVLLLDRIRDLLSQNDEKADRKSSEALARSRSALQLGLLQFWRHAHAVYDLIARSWSCRCSSAHSADLLLLHRTSPDVRLDIVFKYSTTIPPPADAPWKIHSASILLTELPPSPKGKARAVAFTMPASTPDEPPKSEATRIQNLCHAIATASSDPQTAGILSGHGHTNGYSLLPSKDDKALSPNIDVISLGSLLRLELWSRPKRKSRYHIAAILASSHLQLHCSDWLSDGWNHDNIIFLVLNGEPDLTRPHLQRNVVVKCTQSSDPPFDIAFTTLSIILLELCFGYTLETSPFRQKYLLPDGSSDLVQDRLAAWDWLAEVEGEADERWARAVDWCWNRLKVRQEDSRWRQDFYQVVVQPLRIEAGLE